ncbi:MAG: glutaredoxin family protein [Myxococcota bacterium]|jgi:glutaredoxin
MRSFVIAAVMTALVAGLGFALAPRLPLGTGAALPGADEVASDAANAGASAGRAAATAATAPSPAASGKRVFYQWTDERGSVRFAQSLEQVPPQWRAQAGRVEVDVSAYTKSAPAGRESSAYAKASHDITIYTAPWCGWCRKTIAFLDERGVAYANKNIEADDDYADELAEKSGGHSIPFVEIDGTQIRGYNPAKMAALLE